MTIRPFRHMNERGLTLTEVMVVAAIGVLVLLALGGFYVQSQSTWLDASAQSITQREVTLVNQAISDSVRSASRAIVTLTPDADHCELALIRFGQVTPSWYFWWDSSDSLVHCGTDLAAGDKGPMAQSKVERFAISAGNSMVTVSTRARAATGQTVENEMTSVMLNHP